jgi:pimeloyl-ACP methyl ester carboxylesterase
MQIVERVTSPDGTSLAYYRSGAGSPLILVPGTGAANPVAWTAVIPRLEEHFSVCAVDRRGHGKSGDSPTYAIEREFEDIAAIVDSLGEPAYLLGHSFGALCALEAALLTRKIRKLILYEPAIPRPGAPIYPEGAIDRLQALLEAGDPERLLIAYYREVVLLSADEIEQLKSSPAWTERVATAHTLLREARAEDGYEFEPQRFKDLQTPTLFLLGSESPALLKTSTEIVAKALPNSQIEVMLGQQHIAMYSGPDLFLQKVSDFLLPEKR